jgi:hypothetical protein
MIRCARNRRAFGGRGRNCFVPISQLRVFPLFCGLTAWSLVQYSAFRNCKSSCKASLFAVCRRNVPSRRTLMSPAFLSLSKWRDNVDHGGRSQASVPIAENMSAYSVMRSALMRFIVRYLQKYNNNVKPHLASSLHFPLSHSECLFWQPKSDKPGSFRCFLTTCYYSGSTLPLSARLQRSMRRASALV